MKTEIIRIYGIVQGVGFRPFISRICTENKINGKVLNKGSYVEIHAQGNTAGLHEAVKSSPPDRALIQDVTVHFTDEEEYHGFIISKSEHDSGKTFIPADIAVCDACKKELFDPSNRRYLHPFINCTACGPRLTILDMMPYDRERTSMAGFAMCPECAREYTKPSMRRFDAQPVCCNECGPQVYITDTDIRGKAAITAARKAVSEGGIIAVKGIGGFHLCCDAHNSIAIDQLRKAKHRPAKPFAVMMKDISTAKKYCRISPAQERLLCGHEKPVVLLNRKEDCDINAAPDNPYIGVVLPYTPVHLLLFEYDDEILMPDALIMTSANISGAPICINDDEITAYAGNFCKAILSNDREIKMRCDDSVTDVYNDKPYIIRRSRGYSPIPFSISKKTDGCVLALGGELKNTFCIAKNSLFYSSPFVGDMSDMRTVDSQRETIKKMLKLLDAKPSLAVCDLHPDYNSSAAAEAFSLPVMKVQHHYAHILSCMAENDFTEKVIGVAYDGTGYGTDGTIWGGEILLCDMHGFKRLSSLTPFVQSGGDISAKEGWRSAASILDKAAALELCLCSEESYDILFKMREKNINSVISTSAGRIFDAASAVLGIKKASSFEGESACALMFAAEKYTKNSRDYSYTLPLLTEDKKADTNSLVRNIAQRYLNGDDQEYLAYLFHAVLSDMTVQLCIYAAERENIRTAALSGGVFANRMLLELTENKLRENGFTVIHHSLVPPNDGGISLGQAAAGAFYLEGSQCV